MPTPTGSAPDIAQTNHTAPPRLDPEPPIGVTAAVRGHLGLLCRLWGFIATILSVITLFIFLLPAAVVAPFDSHLVTPLQKLMSWIIFRFCGIKVEVCGLENLEGIGQYVAVSNHQSLFDILAVIQYAPGQMRFVAKKEIQKVPLVGFVLARSENIVIDRKAGGKAIRRAAAIARRGYSICVFAEGHRYSDNRVHEFSDGAAWMASVTKLPCVPLAISGTAALMPRGAKFVIPGGHIRLTFGAPIPVTDVRSADRADLTHQLEAAVRSAFTAEVE